ncbi:hypothetical protein Syun_002155 [Stephania yunnanensis]|uniref:Uncharacterized protein n=1 Tax=Stephania yunnanensis TaxID=152371 RepID=A0AAP0LG04_9MAGN
MTCPRLLFILHDRAQSSRSWSTSESSSASVGGANEISRSLRDLSGSSSVRYQYISNDIPLTSIEAFDQLKHHTYELKPRRTRRWREAFRHAVQQFNYHLGNSEMYDALPFMAWLDFKGDAKAMKKTQKDLDYIMRLGWMSTAPKAIKCAATPSTTLEISLMCLS